MTSFRGFARSAWEELPEAALARWASAFFSFSVLALLVSLPVSQALLALAAVAYVLHLLRGQRARTGAVRTVFYSFPPLKLPLALFCLFSLISVFWAANPAAGWLVVRKLVLFLIWLLALNLIVTARHLERLYRVLFLESALAGLVAVAQFATQYRSVRALPPERIYAYMTSDRVRGFMGHWMNFGGQQMLVFAALVSFVLLARGMAAGLEDSGKSAAVKEGAPRSAAGKIWWAILAAVVISIVLNFSRGVWLGCTVALVYLVSRWKPGWLLALPLILFLGYLAAPSLVRQRIRVLRHPTAEPSLSIRFEMWRVALRMIEAHPLVGVGPNSIDQVYVLYLDTGKPPEPGYHQHFHNNFLQFGAERGLPCLAAWVWLMGALAWHFVRIRRRLVREGLPTWTTDAALAAWLALVVEGCFEFNFGTSPVLMLFLFVTSTPFVVDKQARVDG